MCSLATAGTLGHQHDMRFAASRTAEEDAVGSLDGALAASVAQVNHHANEGRVMAVEAERLTELVEGGDICTLPVEIVIVADVEAAYRYTIGFAFR